MNLSKQIAGGREECVVNYHPGDSLRVPHWLAGTWKSHISHQSNGDKQSHRVLFIMGESETKNNSTFKAISTCDV